MAYQYGTGAAVQIGKETIWGTAVTPTDNVNFTSESIAYKITKGDEGSLISSKSVTAKDIMTISVDGSIDFVARPDFMDDIIKYTLGGTDTVTQNTPVTGAHKHSIILQDAATALPSFTTVIDRKQAVKKYSGCKIVSLSLTAKTADYVRGSITLIAKDESSGVKASIAATTLKSYKCKNATLTMGGTTIDAISVTIKIDNALESPAQTFTSALYLPEPMHGQRVVTVEVETPYDANFETVRNTNYMAETLLSTAVVTLASESIITGSTPYSMTITLNNVSVTDATVNVGSAGQLTGKISGQALAISTTEPITWDIFNASTVAL